LCGRTKKYKSVSVKITYTTGWLSIQQTEGKNTMDTMQTEFDVSAGFSVTIAYSDGTGSTSEGDGWSSNSERTTIGHDAIGLTASFARGTPGCYPRDGLDHNPGIDELLSENWVLIEKNLDKVLAMHQRYRDVHKAKRASREQVLSARFWPMVYNNADLSAAQLGAWLQGNTSDALCKRILSQQAALQYLWARHTFVSRHPSNLYWFVFWYDSNV
jgi:hypothetical protein